MAVQLPKRWWEWMLAFTPAIAGWIAPEVARVWLPPIAPLHTQGGDIMNVQAVLQRGLNLTMSTIGVFCLLLAIIYTRRQPSRVRLANTLSVTFCLCVANTFVAFAGCVIISVTRSALPAR